MRLAAGISLGDKKLRKEEKTNNKRNAKKCKDFDTAINDCWQEKRFLKSDICN